MDSMLSEAEQMRWNFQLLKEKCPEDFLLIKNQIQRFVEENQKGKQIQIHEIKEENVR